MCSRTISIFTDHTDTNFEISLMCFRTITIVTDHADTTFEISLMCFRTITIVTDHTDTTFQNNMFSSSGSVCVICGNGNSPKTHR
jgi:hypothetical protein